MRNERSISEDIRMQQDIAHPLEIDGAVIKIARASRIRNTDGFVERLPRVGYVPTEEEKQNELTERPDAKAIAVTMSSEIKMLAAMEDRKLDMARIGNRALLEALGNPYPVLATKDEGIIIARKLMQ